MVRETRHLWVGNLPDNIREDRIREHFKRYGRVQSVKLLPRGAKEEAGEGAMACTVAFMDIKSASKAHNAEHKIDDRTLTTEYYEPAAIPSAASPQNTPSSYSTSPGSTRFPNGHGSTEEHANFSDRFYERPNNRVAESGDFIRRSSTNYHDGCRGRNRDRGYRNGPYNALLDRSHRPPSLSTWSSYEGGAGGGVGSVNSNVATRYTTTTTTHSSQNETGYVSTASDSAERERRSSDQSTKTNNKKSSRSPSPSGSASSASRSRSRSSSSSSSSSTSRDTSSSSEKRPVAIRVKNLPPRSSDSSLKDGLFHEYKKHGKVTWVKVVGQGSERYAIVCFKKPEDVEKALEVSHDKLFFGCKIDVEPYQGYDVEDNDLRPYEAEIDEFHPKATRTLFIGNLEKDVTASDLRKHFDQFGEIIEIDIKKQGAVGSYAFCQYSDIVSVVKAIRTMDGEHLGNNRIKLGFGKSMPTNCVWVDGVVDVNEKYLRLQFEPFGSISKVHVDREKGQALIFYEQVGGAQLAVNKMRGFSVKGSKIQVDFASRECQESFFEHLEKQQGAILDRPSFEERRDSVSRTFDTTTNRFSRYDTPTRPRTSSYSSRSSAATSQVTSAIPSPGTPGSVTPRGTGSRSRISRFPEYYDGVSAVGGPDYCPDRHFRNYDEYSQGSGASHEDGYEHEYPYSSPAHVEAIVPAVINDHVGVPFVLPDIRNLQKERVHLLEQLEELPSSGDELISPKKRLKLDLLETSAATHDVIIEANRDHRKVMEVRRLSDPNLKHHRRPSIDSKHSSRDLVHLPHAVCKRRKTSDSGSRSHHYDHSGPESVGGSRPGTPLVDERPEHFAPSEPRRVPREREGPLTLPLPRFAAQLMGRGSVSVAGIKGQKDNILSSPPPAVTSPRISNPKPPSPVHVPPPASPPPRPSSLSSSNSSDSDNTPPSPSLDERIRSLDEKYEKWSGSRALSASGGEVLAKLDATREKFRLGHKLLDLDLKEVQPSDIVKSVMAKRSVFDEDLKRLENVGEKYEPKEFSAFPPPRVQAPTAVQIAALPPAPLSAPPALKIPPVGGTTSASTTPQLPKTPTMLSPRSAGASVTAAKGLQYPFPSHPPAQLTPPVLHLLLPGAAPTTPPAAAATPPPPAPTLPPTTSSVVVTTSTTTTTSTSSSSTSSTTSTIISNRGLSHGDNNRLKSCASASSDNRTSSKVNVNRSGLTVVANNNNINNNNNSNQQPNIKTSELKNQSVNIPSSTTNNSNASSSSLSSTTTVSDVVTTAVVVQSPINKSVKTTTTTNTTNNNSEKTGGTSDKVSCRRDSSSNSPRGVPSTPTTPQPSGDHVHNIKNRRNSDNNSTRRIITDPDNDKYTNNSDSIISDNTKDEKTKQDEQAAKKEQHRLEKLRQETERLEKERLEKERVDREKQEKERLEKEKLERERLERENELEKERLERERRIKFEREEKEKREREEQLQEEERQERKEAEKKQQQQQKDDNHEKQQRHRDNHVHESIKSSHESSRSDKNRHHIERDSDRRKESVKENRDNNVHDKQKFGSSVESRHMSIDFDRSNKSYSSTTDNNKLNDPSKRKERNNSLPANIGIKRRLSSHDCDVLDEKKIKLNDHKRLSERRDSKDSTRSDEKSKSKHKNNSSLNKSYSEEKSRSSDKHNSDDKRSKEREERHKKQKLEKHKIKSKSREKDCRDSPSTPKSPQSKELTDKDFLARLDLRSNEEIEKQKQLLRKEKKKEFEQQQQQHHDRLRPDDENSKKSEKKDRQRSSNNDDKCKMRDESLTPKSNHSEERSKIKKEHRIRKLTQNSSDNNSDSDEPKKHSIFDIVDDEPAYISMYDKVKARSCKNMQKQEEEKRQEKIKAKFSQLKQSRAKREEKKRSTSWDEDSDSDRGEKDVKTKRGSKLCIMSSDEEETNLKIHHKKLEIYTDSDSERPRQIKSEETSDDDRIRSKLQRKGSKSRITSDTSDDEMKKIQNQIKSEIFSDNEIDQGFADSEDKLFGKSSTNELNRIVKKERINNKHPESIVDQMNAQIFGDSSSPLPDIKPERFNNRHFVENSSADETGDVKKERVEIRKKHKKKQKRQKHSLSSEESNKLESIVDGIITESSDKSKHHDKKKQHSKKEKKRDKSSKDEREKSRKSKKNKSDIKSDLKRDGKMENIFGSLSEDSEKEAEQSNNDHKTNSFNDTHHRFNETNNNPQTSVNYTSDSDREQEKLKMEEKEREAKEEHRKRKEKKRREKERRLQEEAAAAAAAAASSVSISEPINENSMDFADMGKQLEANIKDDSMEDAITVKTEPETNTEIPPVEDNFRFNNTNDFSDKKEEHRKEAREKKKKRKKSKEEKQKHHHHHHHSDKNKIKSESTTTVKKESSSSNSQPSPLEEIKIEIDEKPVVVTSQQQSLPNLDVPSPPQNKSSSSLDYSISPIPRDALISPIPKTPTTSKEKKREKFIPGFGGTEIDEKIHENAVKSISDFDSASPEIVKPVEEPKPLPPPEQPEEKPRVVISQEETEDAVAALLGESFGSGQFQECYNEEDEDISTNITGDPVQRLVEDNVVQDDEEMRQAVQSLSSVTDIDAKPDTPQSEHELQIDTDTEEQEDNTNNVRFDQPPKTPEITEQRPKTPEITNYYKEPEKINKSVSISSPPSLAPITKPSEPPKVTLPPPPAPREEVKVSLSLPMLPEPPHTVISQAWNVDKKDIPKAEPPTASTPPLTSKSGALRTYGPPPPIVKIAENVYPPLTAITKQEHTQITNEPIKIQTSFPVLQTNPKALHNLPACSPVQPPQISDANKPQTSSTNTNLSLNRLPITPVMVSKPMQMTAVILPQPKMAAHTLEPPMLVSTTETRPRMVFQQTSSVTTPPPPFANFNPTTRMVAKSNLLIPSGPPRSYAYVPPYSSVISTKEPNHIPETKLVPSTQNSVVKQSTIIVSTQQQQHQNKPFMPVIKETPPKLVGLPDIRISQPSTIIQQVKTTVPTPEPIKEQLNISEDHLKITETRTSTPSPVIVQTPPKEPEVKVESIVKIEEPKPLAIEQVTDELNLTLKKEVVNSDKREEDTPEQKPEKSEVFDDTKDKPQQPETIDTKPVEDTKPEPKPEPIKEEEKTDTESIVSDISKERSSADILNKDDQLDKDKEDSDYWSAKEVNIDSVIKTLCSADELSDQSSTETGKDDWFDDGKVDTETKSEDSPKKDEICDETETFEESCETTTDDKEVATRGRRGGRARGRKSRGGLDRGGIQTRRGKAAAVTTPAIKRGGGRGAGRQRGERKSSKSESEQTSGDVYEFRDDSDEANKERPRLILTIKSPAVNPTPTTTVVKEVKEVVKEIVKEPSPKPQPVVEPPPIVENKEEFLSPVANTRKSRRLQERDVLRNTVDDTIEDVVRNTVMVTRSSNQNARRSARQAVKPTNLETPRKSPRGGRKKDRRASDPCDDSSEEKSKTDSETKSESDLTELEKPKEVVEKEEVKVEVVKEGFKGAMLRRIKGEMSQEPTALIDPVTGLLTPMRECEEGRYIPVPKPNDNVKSVIATQQPATTMAQQQQLPPKPKPQSLKAHVLSSQAAKAVVAAAQTQPQPQPQTLPVKKSIIVTQAVPTIQQQTVVSKPSIPLSQNLNINVSLANYTTAHLSPRSSLPVNVMSKAPPSPIVPLSNQMKQQIQQQVNKQIVSKSLIVTPMVQPPIINTQVAHLKQPQPQQQQHIKQAVISKAKPHPQQIMHGAVASPPLTKGPIPGLMAGANQSRIVAPPHGKGVMEPPQVDVHMLGAMKPNLSPQGQPRHITQSGMPVPAYEASLHGERSIYNRSRSPPPAHQNSPSPQGETIAHFPGAVPLRPPHDLTPAHYMHPSHVMPFQFLRQTYRLPRSPMVPGGLEKSDGQEGEEAPVTSPPLELRRPGSVGLALTGRTTVVPHSLHSPHDRTTDSPQVGQVYNVHSARMQHYHSTGRYYEQTAEPPPAHRPLTSHGTLTALANDRSISHMASLGAPERPMSGHLQPDRPLSSHSALAAHMGGLPTTDRPPLTTHMPDRPLSNHSLAMGAGLGAAGNLMGAVARHVGVDASASQRGLQAATPPHASQVPPQAESLFMLLKQYPCMWQGLLALKNDQAAVQMYFVSGNDNVAKCSLPKNTDGSTPPLRIFQRMRLEPPQVEGVARKMQMENEHCMLLALPCGHDHMDVLKQSTNLTNGFITYLQQKQAAGIVNVAAPGTTQPPAYVVHIFPSCDFVNDNLRRIAPSLLERVADIAHLLIVITTV